LKIPTVHIQGKILGNGDTNYLLVSEISEEESNRNTDKFFFGQTAEPR
jgi:hypothetical protein